MITLYNLPWISHYHIFNVYHRVTLLVPSVIFIKVFNSFLIILATLSRGWIVPTYALNHISSHHVLIFILWCSTMGYYLLWRWRSMQRVWSSTQINEIISTVVWLYEHILLTLIRYVDLASIALVLNVILSIIGIASSCGGFVGMTYVTERILVTHVQVLLGSCFLSLVQ